MVRGPPDMLVTRMAGQPCARAFVFKVFVDTNRVFNFYHKLDFFRNIDISRSLLRVFRVQEASLSLYSIK
jgi:hypothetical protein